MSGSPSADPGLDLRHLAGLRRQTHPTTALVDRIAAHLDQNDGYLAFSGYGNVQPEDIIIHTDTGKRYVAGTNVYRSSPEDFAGMELL